MKEWKLICHEIFESSVLLELPFKIRNRRVDEFHGFSISVEPIDQI